MFSFHLRKQYNTGNISQYLFTLKYIFKDSLWTQETIELFNICGTMTIATIVHFSEGCQVFEAKIGTSVFLWVYAQLNSATNTTSPNIFPK